MNKEIQNECEYIYLLPREARGRRSRERAEMKRREIANQGYERAMSVELNI